jgi:hypothetical protein
MQQLEREERRRTEWIEEAEPDHHHYASCFDVRLLSFLPRKEEEEEERKEINLSSRKRTLGFREGKKKSEERTIFLGREELHIMGWVPCDALLLRL